MGHRCTSFLRFTIIALLILEPSPLWAQTSNSCSIPQVVQQVRDNPADAAGIFMDLADNSCLGMENCTQNLCLDTKDWADRWQAVHKLHASSKAEDQAMQAEAFDLFAKIWRQAKELPVDQPGAKAFLKSLVEFRLDSSGDLIRQLQQDPQGAKWDVQAYSLFSGEAKIDAVDILDIACIQEKIAESSGVESCIATFRTQVEIFTLSGLQTRILSNILKESLDATVAYIDALNRRWQQYFTKGRAILPWELALNGWMYKPERGFNEPPSSQFILLHPTPAIGLEEGNLDDGKLSLAVEVVGWYGWRWGGEDLTEMKAPVELPGVLDDFPLGGAFVVGFDGDDDPGFGGLVHLPRNWSVGGMVDLDGNFTLLVSADLFKLFTNPEKHRAALVSSFRGE